ncbi:uncharacterized protein LOC134815861 [Bolinopsis microptera]|uniref:uncharacterized protein LOC134815861 n=1 Tax=Bolinopsis microptera TaxID=2820187 RepID=UPI0030793A30
MAAILINGRWREWRGYQVKVNKHGEGNAWRTAIEGCDCENINGYDFKATDIDYDIDAGRVYSAKPDFVVHKELKNGGSRDLVVPITSTIEVSESISFTHTAGASVTVGTSFEVGVPLITSAEISTEISASYEFSAGNDKTVTKTMSVEFACTAPPRKRAVCNAVMLKNRVDIPYVLTWSHKRMDECICKEKGIFEEVVANRIEMQVQEFDLSKVVQAKREDITGGFDNFKRD